MTKTLSRISVAFLIFLIYSAIVGGIILAFVGAFWSGIGLAIGSILVIVILSLLFPEVVRTSKRLLWDIFLPLAIVFTAIAGGFYLFSLAAPNASKAMIEVRNAYPLFRDILQIVLATIAVALTASGYLVYELVSERLKRKAGEEIRNEARRSIIRVTTNAGYSFWKLCPPRFQPPLDIYELREQFLKEAIRLTKLAHDEVSKLHEREPMNQELIGAVRNNLASYLAQAGEERNLARGYAEYIHRNSHQFPEQRDTWEETYKEVLRAFPD